MNENYTVCRMGGGGLRDAGWGGLRDAGLRDWGFAGCGIPG